MRLIGVRRGDVTYVCESADDGVYPIAPVELFFREPSRWLEGPRASEPIGEVQRSPAVWPGARILCVGLNYRAHAAEGGFAPPDYPAIFGRWTRSLITDGDAIPALDEVLDWEGELATVIGRPMADVDEQAALEGVLGYAAFNDVSARTFQRHTHQWTPGKNMDRSGVIGPIVTADDVGDPRDGLALQTRLNGELMQSATTADMIFSVGQIISYLSRIMTLYPGDVIATGTPQGVGYARTPPILMKAGDIIEVTIEKVGTIRNPIVDRSERERLSPLV